MHIRDIQRNEIAMTDTNNHRYISWLQYLIWLQQLVVEPRRCDDNANDDEFVDLEIDDEI